LFRFVGGKISKTTPVTVTTPSATLAIRGGIMIVSVDSTRTVAIFVHGIEMTMSALGHVTIVNRTGWQATTFAGKVPGQPAPTPPGSLGPELRQLEAIGGQPSDADNAAKTSGFSDQNSGLGPGGGGGNNTTLGGEATNAVSNANNSLQRPTLPPVTPPPVTPPPVTPPPVTPPPVPTRGPFN
jgi:hypothetical protein